MGLLPEARGQGGGRALLAELVPGARARGDRRLLLEVFESNAPARALYEHAGFRTTTRLVGYESRQPQATPADLREIDPAEFEEEEAPAARKSAPHPAPVPSVPVATSETLDVQLLTQQQAIDQGVVKVVVDPFVVAYNAAVEAYQAADYEAAWAKAQEAVKAGPEKANAYDLAAKVALKRKDWDGVIAMGEKSLALEADNPALTGSLMDAYRAKGDKVKAAEYEKKYIAANPDQPDVIYNQAVELYNKGNFKEAAPILAKVVDAKPDHAKAHFLLGMCDVNLNKIPDMKKHLNEYLKLDPKGSDAATAKEMLDAFK